MIDDPLVFLAQPDSLIVTNEFARRNGLRLNSTIDMKTMDGAKRFTIRGIMRSTGIGSTFGGNLAIMDVYSAQRVFGRGERFDRIDVRLKDGYTVEQGQTALRNMLGPGFQIDLPSTRGGNLNRCCASIP